MQQSGKDSAGIFMHLSMFNTSDCDCSDQWQLYISSSALLWKRNALTFCFYVVFLDNFSFISLFKNSFSPFPDLGPCTYITPSTVSLSVSVLPPCLRLSLPLFAFNSWGHPGPLGCYPRMLSRLTSCRVAFCTDQAAEPGLHQYSDSTVYLIVTMPTKNGEL